MPNLSKRYSVMFLVIHNEFSFSLWTTTHDTSTGTCTRRRTRTTGIIPVRPYIRYHHRSVAIHSSVKPSAGLSVTEAISKSLIYAIYSSFWMLLSHNLCSNSSQAFANEHSSTKNMVNSKFQCYNMHCLHFLIIMEGII